MSVALITSEPGTQNSLSSKASLNWPPLPKLKIAGLSVQLTSATPNSPKKKVNPLGFTVYSVWRCAGRSCPIETDGDRVFNFIVRVHSSFVSTNLKRSNSTD